MRGPHSEATKQKMSAKAKGRPGTSGSFREGDGRKRGGKTGRSPTAGSFSNGMQLTKKQSEAGLSNLREAWANREGQRAACNARIVYERHAAAAMVADGYEVVWPLAVCDRIAIKNGKVYFVEFKKPGQQLRPSQQRVHDLVPHMYQVIESDLYLSSRV